MFAARHVFPEGSRDKENYKAGCDSLSSFRLRTDSLTLTI
jgi:hypothetical protein